MTTATAKRPNLSDDLTVEQRVANGVLWLDKHAPANWRDTVTVENLDMASGCSCILGQVFDKRAKIEAAREDGVKNPTKLTEEQLSEFDYTDGFGWATSYYEGKSGSIVMCDQPWKFGFDATYIAGYGTGDWDEIGEAWKAELAK